jgi:cysteinyl-tRNA synthetase
MALKVYNTLSRGLEVFRPLIEGEVRVYICGLTVYDDMHIGHARTYLAFDAILRYLRFSGYKVRYVQNVTDIDDKIVRRAKERGKEPLALSEEYAARAREDQRMLGLVEADVYPKVSENIGGIIDATRKLIASGNAYVTDRGVYFDVSGSTGYGGLSHQDTEQLGQHRIEPDPQKRNALDFSLWKAAKDGEMGFESPWGLGRPGWHIECSVMARRFLGDQLDIHGGALDLIFPHHENEAAQSEALTGKRPFVRYWLHTGFLNSSGEKMSKSLGNIVSVREFLESYPADAFRLFIMQTHYRSPVDYSPGIMGNAAKAVERLRSFRAGLAAAAANATGAGEHARDAAVGLREAFISSMDEDFNTPEAVSAVFDAVRRINAAAVSGGESAGSLKRALEVFDEVVGALGFDFCAHRGLSAEEAGLLQERRRLRAAGKWAESDRIRDTLLGRGLRLRDMKDGSTVVEPL